MLYFEIFKLDWLFIDTVIIIFLLSILLIVKLFKLKSRWRFTFSNTSLSKLKIENTYSNDKKSTYYIKNMNIMKNMYLKGLTHPIVGFITFSSNKYSKLNLLHYEPFLFTDLISRYFLTFIFNDLYLIAKFN